jgi:bacterial/archaeal transporter family-2 protein
MGWIWILPFAVGVAAVVQGGLNRQLAKSMPLASAVLINGIIFCISAFIYWYFRREESPSGLWPWWILIPGVCGFFLVIGIPYGISRLGATPVFICLIASQIVASVVWDLTIEGHAISMARWVGAGLAMLGAIVMIKG